MRTEEEIKNLVVDFANSDERIRTVLLNGSRANPDIKPDKLQDFDILFIVRNFESFISDHSWTNVFGDKLIWQLPDEMIYVGGIKKADFSYLMIFKDGSRIDLTIFPIEQLVTNYTEDSLTMVWVDKDRLFPKENEPSDRNYYVSRPTEKEFLETCNEFWWSLLEKGFTVSQVAFDIGFSNHSHFSRLFRDKYGMLPSEYARNQG
jgi:aminoglycoside 6-adenylyltransferase